MVGAVGDDGNGALLRDSVAASGADTTDVVVRPGTATGTAVITVDGRGENTIVISGGANATFSAEDLPADLFRDAAVLGLCLEVPMEAVLAAARAAHAAGVTVLTNLSPFGDVPPELLDLTDVLLVNEHEAAALGDHGVARSIVTRGGDGSVVHDGDAAPVEVPAVPVDAVDTTGCGDAFMGGGRTPARRGGTRSSRPRASQPVSVRTRRPVPAHRRPTRPPRSWRRSSGRDPGLPPDH
ncbi:PfkB family carbohydrate kinase [Curtobacterium sp. MCPF17_052]|uniref:PfkB family carbohydrate kinase n=1 Tax=Curtobacterium sp. MCPF17_052 TaxID=2175655 RepID=UPI0024DFE06E|nr:PfkB family carbohydrate kinase [Curtobacterium sp. MCPF17_052]WIB11603.1 PfkB family carbohydrate kinase [Curtobacterium sp. MCPF17_052]